MIDRHDNSFRDGAQAFEIVARVWHHHKIEEGKQPKLSLRSIGREFGLPDVMIDRIGVKAFGHIRKRLHAVEARGLSRQTRIIR